VEDGHSWTLRIASPQPERATAYVRRHRFDVGMPLDFDEDYGEITALEYALGALAADLVMGVRRAARRLRVRIDNIEAVVRGTVDNPLTWLRVVGEEGHPALARVTLKVYVGSADDAGQVDAAFAEALATSPLALTFRKSVDLKIEHEVVL
jgi:hypothetical protein